MSLRYVCVEVRHNLRCANVFLQFDHSLTETEFLKIVVENDALTFREYSTATRVALGKFFTAEARTISNLTVEECNASFRLTITNEPAQGTADNKENQIDNKRKIYITPKPNIEEGSQHIVLCKNCKCELSTTLQCRRVREFPSGSIDVNEFFCHHGPKFDEVLVPQLTDFFYGFQFVVLNSELSQQQVKMKDKHVYCRRCLQYLGENILNDNAMKLWMDTLLLKCQPNDKDDTIINVVNEKVTPTCQLLHKIIDDTLVTDVAGEPLLQQMHFCKVLLEATFPCRKRKYLLLQVLEKQLQVLRNTKPLAHGSHNNNNVLQVQLEQCKSFKLLYRLLDETEDEGGGDDKRGEKDSGETSSTSSTSSDSMLLKNWKEDMSIHVLKVSPTLFGTLLDELDENALLLPELYRYTHDHFQLSYIFYED
uniref:E3 ubiquitin-protein ligase E3D n=1 Tax=Bactrocera dorsalis TaxID=27457 RepID=A0A034VKD8_BACDO